MQRHLRRLIATSLLILTALLALPGVTRAQVDTSSSAQATLYQYYTFINRGDFPSAYALWANSSQTLEQFQTGFSTTERVVPYFNMLETSQPLGNAGTVRAVLLGYETDGSVQSYAGCFGLGLNAGRWQITGSNFVQVLDGAPPDRASIDALLLQPCTSDPTTVPITPKTTSDADTLLLSTYDAINSGQYEAAYAAWLQPLPGPKPNGGPAVDYRLPFDTFRAGYTDTAYVYVYPGEYVQTGASAGHSYLDGFLPAVLVGQHTDGSFAAYYGCYVTGRHPNGNLGIVNGRFFLFETQVPNAASIQQHLNIDCTTLAIPN